MRFYQKKGEAAAENRRCSPAPFAQLNLKPNTTD